MAFKLSTEATTLLSQRLERAVCYAACNVLVILLLPEASTLYGLNVGANASEKHFMGECFDRDRVKRSCS